MGEEDSSWSSVGSGYSGCPNQEDALLLKEMKFELAKRDELIQSLQDELEDVKQGMKTVKEDKESAVKLLQATLRTETLLDKLDGKSTDYLEEDIIETIGTLVEGSRAFGDAELKEKAIKFGKAVLKGKPSLAGAVLVACDKNPMLKDSELEEGALEKLRLNPQEILVCGNALSALSAVGIEKILKDPKMEANEYTMFEILEAWTKSAGANSLGETFPYRRNIAFKLVDQIALDLIDPTLLVTAVRDSGIVTAAQLVDAFAKQAPLVKDRIAFQTKRSVPVDKSMKCTWNTTKTNLHSQSSGGPSMDTVVGRVMKSGTHKWNLRVEKGHNICFGIVSASSKNVGRGTSVHLGYQPGEWGFYGHSNVKLWYDGSVKSENIPGQLKVKENSTVNFTLSLGPQNSLEASVDGGTPVILFKGPELPHDGSGFVPAASIYSNGSVRFLGFE